MASEPAREDTDGPMPLRAIRVPERIWRPALQRAREDGTTVSAVVRVALEEYGQGDDA